MLPDRSILIGQKLVENAKIEKVKCDFFGDFQTLCVGELMIIPAMLLEHDFYIDDTFDLRTKVRICANFQYFFSTTPIFVLLPCCFLKA